MAGQSESKARRSLDAMARSWTPDGFCRNRSGNYMAPTKGGTTEISQVRLSHASRRTPMRRAGVDGLAAVLVLRNVFGLGDAEAQAQCVSSPDKMSLGPGGSCLTPGCPVFVKRRAVRS